MCYAYGSIDQATKICPMCKVFRPSTARCPHVKEVCHNRSLHPRHDVIYLKNAEVQSFNGCGYCKWAKTNPPPKSSGYQNLGWPGCCRPPAANEQRMIQAADWPSVSVVHQISIPAEIKALLDSLSSRGSPTPAIGAGQRGSPSTPLLNIGNASPPNKFNTVGKTSPMTIPVKGRQGGSPQQMVASLTGNSLRSSGGNVSSSVPSVSSMEQYQIHRRAAYPEFTDKRTESSHSAHSSPNRKNIDLDGSISRRNSGGRIPIKPSTPPMSVAKLSLDDQPTPLRVSSKISPPNATRSIDRSAGSVTSRAQPKRASIEISSASSSSGSSDGMGSLTDGTVTSDGGFTDYLSDESEAELQRQAEAKAALVAQNHAEEQEFKAARQQLAHVDLRPPKSWNPPSSTSTSRLSGPSSHVSSYSPGIPYSSVPFTSSPMAQAGAQSTG